MRRKRIQILFRGTFKVLIRSSFHRDAQYKYHTNKKWALKKRLTARQKEKMIASIQNTVLQGKPSAPMACDAIMARKLIRHLKRTPAPCLAIAPSQAVDIQSRSSGSGVSFVQL